nr:MAG TPA: N-acetylmuramoyl-L-alanine amidase [Caudoviricetes sp.]
MSNSALASYVKLSPNHSGRRKYVIDRITPHCVVGQLSVEALGNIFANSKRRASCQYGIGADGRVGLYCDETNRSWCSSSADNDNRAVTIECASDTVHPYAFNDKVYQKLIDLCVDICKRNGKNKLLWISDKNKALAYKPKSNEMLLTVHRWFANKACPGDWLYSRLGELARAVTKKLGEAEMKQTEHWARENLNNLVKKGLIKSPEAHQNLDATITKGEIFAILDRLTDRK